MKMKITMRQRENAFSYRPTKKEKEEKKVETKE